jgi:predicted TIM-barrel fold metal-dependent hydrolase
MMIADSQIHLWIKSSPPKSSHHRQQAVFSKDDLLKEMNGAGVDRAVIVPPSWEDNEHALFAAHQHPTRFAAMGRLALGDPASRNLIGSWKSQQGMLGLRLPFNGKDRELFLDGAVDWLWPLAERGDIPIMIRVPGLLDRIEKVASQHPGLRLAIDHMGSGGDVHAPQAFEELPRVLALAKYKNIAIKASGLMGYSNDPYPFKDIHEPVRRAIDAFGPERVFWGTDLSRIHCSYRQCVTCFTEEMPWLSERDKALVMGKALCDWIGWNIS